jgi:hypothetical protein
VRWVHARGCWFPPPSGEVERTEGDDDHRLDVDVDDVRDDYDDRPDDAAQVAIRRPGIVDNRARGKAGTGHV